MKHLKVKLFLSFLAVTLSLLFVIGTHFFYTKKLSELASLIAPPGPSKNEIVEIVLQGRPDPQRPGEQNMQFDIVIRRTGERKSILVPVLNERAFLQINTLSFKVKSLPGYKDDGEPRDIPLLYRLYLSIGHKYKIYDLAPADGVPFMYRQENVPSFIQARFWRNMWVRFLSGDTSEFNGSHNLRIELPLEHLMVGDTYELTIAPSGEIGVEYPFISNIRPVRR